MTDLDHRVGLCSLVTLSNEKAPAPSGHATTRTRPAPAASGPLTADARPIADPVPTRPGPHPLPRPHDRLHSFQADRKRE